MLDIDAYVLPVGIELAPVKERTTFTVGRFLSFHVTEIADYEHERGNLLLTEQSSAHGEPATEVIAVDVDREAYLTLCDVLRAHQRHGSLTVTPSSLRRLSRIPTERLRAVFGV
jgi:hypothetical protein